MKTLVLIFFFIFMAFAAIPQETNYADLPVTTDSPQALKFYQQGINDIADVNIDQAKENFTRAVEMDPEFMQANMEMAIFSLLEKDSAKFKSFANRAINSKASLNQSEKVMQQAMQKLLDDQKADLTSYFQEVVSQNPNSYEAHSLLAYFQQRAGHSEEAVKTYESMLSLPQNPASVYNTLGYAYMGMNQMDKAKDAFEKYIQNSPDNPNAYDSMGDYYAKVQDFKEAQTSYMKAYDMDSTRFKISQQKAQKIKEQVAEK